MTDIQFAVREAAIAAYIEGFIAQVREQENEENYGIDFADVDAKEAGKRIVSLYERYVENVVRPLIKSSTDTIHHSKIISNTELCVLRVAPIDHPDENTRKMLNARLAYAVGISMMIDWNNDLPKEEIIKSLKESPELIEFQKEHLTWLCLVDTRYEFPIFSNAQVWKLFLYYIKDRLKK